MLNASFVFCRPTCRIQIIVLLISYLRQLSCNVCRPRPTVCLNACEQWIICPTPPLFAGADVLPSTPCSLNIPNLCDTFVKKLVSETRKCLQLHGDFVPLTL